MDLTDLMADLTDRFPEGVLDSCTLGGKLWCFPYYDASGTTCFYNRSLFEEYGLSVPTNLDEWTECAKVFTENGIIPFMVQGKDTWAWAMPFFDTYGQSTGGDSVEQVEAWLRGEKTFEDDQVYEALDALKALYDNGILTSESFDTDEDGMLANFAQGNCAMIFCGTWDYATLLSMDLDFDYAACEFPVMIDGANPCHAFATGDGAIAIPTWADQDNLENTMRFVEFLTRSENAKKIICAQAGGSPLFEIVNGALGETDEVTEFLNNVSVPNSVEYLDWIWPTEVNDAMCNVVPAVISGSMTEKEAAAYVQETLDKLVSEEGYVYDWWDEWTDEQWDSVTPKTVPDLTQYMK
jgi:raffinose/stachyose/melibiose transport system substrate-binding protein